MCHRPDHHATPVHGILFISPPSFSMSLVPVPCSTLPAAKNIRHFIRAWFQMWSSPAAIAQHGHGAACPLAEHHRPDAQGQADQPHVLDAGVGEHSLDVALVNGQRDPDQGREQAEHGERQPPPGGGRPEEGQDAQEPVEAHLDHHARHQGGNVRGSGRMGFGQPDVERNKARLRPEADQGRGRRSAPTRQASSAGIFGKAVEFQTARVAAQQHKSRKQESDAQMGGDQIDPTGPAHFGLFVFERHQEKGRERHHLPRQQEQEARSGR